MRRVNTGNTSRVNGVGVGRVGRGADPRRVVTTSPRLGSLWTNLHARSAGTSKPSQFGDDDDPPFYIEKPNPCPSVLIDCGTELVATEDGAGCVEQWSQCCDENGFINHGTTCCYPPAYLNPMAHNTWKQWFDSCCPFQSKSDSGVCRGGPKHSFDEDGYDFQFG